MGRLVAALLGLAAVTTGKQIGKKIAFFAPVPESQSNIPVGVSVQSTGERANVGVIPFSFLSAINIPTVHDIWDADQVHFNFNTPSGKKSVISNKKRFRDLEDHAIWVGTESNHGVDNDQPDEQVILTLYKNYVAGSVSLDGELYEITPSLGGIMSTMILVDPENMPIHLEPPVPIPPSGKRSSERRLEESEVNTRGNHVIDVMVVYTQQVRASSRNIVALAVKLLSWVDYANVAYENSSVNAEFRLVHMVETTYTESETGFAADLNWVTNNSDMKTIRKLYGADMVSLVRKAGISCGTGWILQNNDETGWPYNVVSIGCSSDTFVHEMTHNLGCHHDTETAGSGGGVFPYSYGYRNCDKGWRTIMAYTKPGCGIMINQLSNPDTLHKGDPIGIAGKQDCARSVNAVAPVAAAYQPTRVTGRRSFRRQREKEFSSDTAGLPLDIGLDVWDGLDFVDAPIHDSHLHPLYSQD